MGDGRYGTATNIVGMEQDGMCAYLARPDHRSRTGVYPQSDFTYDLEQDCYLCPQGQRLPRSSSDARKGVTIYRAPAKVCKRCPVKPQCTTGCYGRLIQRSPFKVNIVALLIASGQNMKPLHSVSLYETIGCDSK